MSMTRGWLALAVFGALSGAWPAWAQTPAPTPAPAEEAAKEAEKPKTFWDENKLFAYIENSYTFNLTGSGRGGTNELRLYDYHEGYTFNVGEFSLKKDPSEKYPFGYGLVVTAGIDPQKNHSFGIFRDEQDAFPFRNTEKFDLQEAYLSGTIPVGSGLTLKGGKFVTLLGYEVIESPNNLNFSRGYLFGLAVPLTNTGGLASYTFTDWFNVTAGVILGWDDSKNVNDRPSYTGQLAFTPVKDLSANLNWIAGPEQIDNNNHQRYVLDWVVTYTGFKNWTLGLNVDYGHEDHEPTVAATRKDGTAVWWGWAGYAAYDWTDKLRTAVRQEFFRDAGGGADGPGQGTRPVVDDGDDPVQDLAGAGGAAGVPARSVGRQGVPDPVLGAGPGRAGAAAPEQEPGHLLDEPLLLVLLGCSSSGRSLSRAAQAVGAVTAA